MVQEANCPSSRNRRRPPRICDPKTGDGLKLTIRQMRRLATFPSLLACAGCAPLTGFLDPAGPIAAEQRTHFWIICALMLTVIVPIFLGIPFLLWRYRYRGGRSKARFEPDWEYSGRWELFLWGGPVVLVAVLAVLLWSQTQKLDPYRPLAPDPLEVQVIGYDWAWLFIYPDQNIATVNRLVIPEGRAVSLSLTSQTVMQSFFVPALAGQIYVMGGMETHLNLLADDPGRWPGRNTQYNGKGFYRQVFMAEALPPAQFDDWVLQAQAAPPLDPAIATGWHLPEDIPTQFGSVPPDMFGRLMTHFAHEGAE